MRKASVSSNQSTRSLVFACALVILLGVTRADEKISFDTKPVVQSTASNLPSDFKGTKASQVHAVPHPENDGNDSIEPPVFSALHNLIENHCLACHDNSDDNHGINLQSASLPPNDSSLPVWEQAVRKISTGQMPPSDSEQPSDSLRTRATSELTQSLDQLAQQKLNVGRTATFRRLTRFEYQNAIRDLFQIDIDASTLLPPDEISHGFDNVTVGELSPSLLNRYVTAAQKISRLVMASDAGGMDAHTFRTPPDRTQEEHVEGLPLGTRGGIFARHYFSRPGEYEFTIRLTRDRNEHVEGLKEPHDLDLIIDRDVIESFRVYPPRGNSTSDDDYTKPSHENVDRHLTAKIHIESGMHEIGVTFIKNQSSLIETSRKPLDVHYNMYRHPRLGPAVFELSITGPHTFAPNDSKTNSTTKNSTPNNSALSPWPINPDEQDHCAESILIPLAERVFRRSLSESDREKLLNQYHHASSANGFARGIEFAISYLLIHPQFLFKIELDPKDQQPANAYKIDDFALASRLSFFLWSSIPDETLLQLAKKNQLSRPSVLKGQIKRMLLDSKSQAFTTNFSGQWLYLRNLDSLTPDARLYPNFDDNLRQAFRTETELFIADLIQDNRPIRELIDTDHTFLNERLAKHYEIPGVFGSHFRKVYLNPESNRGGLLRQGSILSVTSYANRTSPVLRGKWILENLIGTPPPPPPPNTPNLDEVAISENLTVQERLKLHRENEACAVCHRLIDPIGFTLENFDALGRWRTLDQDLPIDSTGSLPNGTKLSGLQELESALIKRTDIIAYCLAEKLMIYAIGRGIEPTDAPHIRKVVALAQQQDYRIHAMIEAVILSPLFQMRMPQS